MKLLLTIAAVAALTSATPAKSIVTSEMRMNKAELACYNAHNHFVDVMAKYDTKHDMRAYRYEEAANSGKASLKKCGRKHTKEVRVYINELVKEATANGKIMRKIERDARAKKAAEAERKNPGQAVCKSAIRNVNMYNKAFEDSMFKLNHRDEIDTRPITAMMLLKSIDNLKSHSCKLSDRQQSKIRMMELMATEYAPL